MSDPESKREDKFESAVRKLLRQADENRNYVVGAMVALLLVAGAIYFKIVSARRVENEAWAGLSKADTTGLLRERWNKDGDSSAGIFLAEELAGKLWDEQYDLADKDEDNVVERRTQLLDEGISVLTKTLDEHGGHAFAPHVQRMLDTFRQERSWVQEHGAEILASKDPVPKEMNPHPGKMEQSKPLEDKPGQKPLVTLKTDRGDIVVELFEDDAPNHVANFVSLVLEGAFDGLVFPRVEDWVVQTGCPDGTGAGGPGYRIKAEINKHGHDRGALGMAHVEEDIDSAGSQFYFVKKEEHDIDAEFTIFGRVLSGMDVVDRIRKGDKLVEVVPNRLRQKEYRPLVIYTKPRSTPTE